MDSGGYLLKSEYFLTRLNAQVSIFTEDRHHRLIIPDGLPGFLESDGTIGRNLK